MEDLSGRQLGPYRIVAALGSGGMATVYRAFQPNMDRYVALKILPRYYADDPEFSGRFVQEARLIASLQHPHILPVHDFGEAGGYTYLVMPLIEGGTLARTLRTYQPLPLSQIERIVCQVGDALDYAHSRGIVHRDLKPSNVLLDQRGNCLLGDFGVAKMVEGNVHFTRTGGVVGTPAYMSPEQGLGRKIDRRSDIYALGVLLFEMAVGHPPFEADTPVAVMLKHVHDPLPLPRQHNPDLPEPLETVILKALAKDPEDRYQSAGAMVEALQGAIDEAQKMIAPAEPAQPTEIEQPAAPAAAGWTPQRGPGEPRATTVTPAATPVVKAPAGEEVSSASDMPGAVTGRRPLPRRFLSIGAVIVVVGLIAAFALLTRGDGVEDGDATSIALLGETAEEEGGVADVAVAEEEVAPEVQALLADLDRAYEANDMDLAIALLSRATELEPEQAELFCALGDAQRNVWDLQAAHEQYSRCRDLAVARNDAGLAAEARGGLAIVEVRRTLDEQSDPHLALAVFDQALQQERVAPWLSCEKGQIALEYGLHEAAVEAFEVCLATASRDEARQRQAQIGLAQSRGFIAYEIGDSEAALAHFREWAELAPDEPWSHCTMGDVLNWDLERYEEALEAYQRCRERVPDEDDQVWAMENMALVQASMAVRDERWDEAIAFYGDAIAISPGAAYLYCERGDLFLELGDVQNGRADAQRCLDLSGDDEGVREWAEDLLRKAEGQP